MLSTVGKLNETPAREPSDAPRRTVASYALSAAYTEVACEDGSLWRWRKAHGWRRGAVVPGSLTARAVERDGTLDGYEVRPNE